MQLPDKVGDYGVGRVQEQPQEVEPPSLGADVIAFPF